MQDTPKYISKVNEKNRIIFKDKYHALICDKHKIKILVC